MSHLIDFILNLNNIILIAYNAETVLKTQKQI